jgi:WD40 repeat protein
MVLFGAAMSQVSSSFFISFCISIQLYMLLLVSKMYLYLMVAGDSGRLITGSADTTAKLWNVQTGQQLFTFNFGAPTKSVDFSVGDKLAVITTDPFMELSSAIHVKRIAKDPEDRKQPLSLSIYNFFYCQC